jgi:hypothetical protein
MSRRLMALIIVVTGCNRSHPIKIQINDAPGTYLFEGHDSRDELVLDADGRFTRTAVYRGARQMQTGRWEMSGVSPSDSYATFSNLQPTCLHSNAKPGAFFQWTEPDQTLCSGPHNIAVFIAPFCSENDRPSLCLGEDNLVFQKL